VTGEVYRCGAARPLIMDKDDNELVMPKGEQIPQDRFREAPCAP
jgi:N utilization substance protein A